MSKYNTIRLSGIFDLYSLDQFCSSSEAQYNSADNHWLNILQSAEP